MKVAIVFLTGLALASAAPRSSINEDLRPALNELLKHIDLVKLSEIIPQLAQTEDAKEFLAYVQGPDFRAAIDAVKAEPTIQDFLTYLENNGLDNVREVIRLIGEALGIKPTPLSVGTKSLSDLIVELLTAVDYFGLLISSIELLGNDMAFRNLYYRLASDEDEAGWFRLKANPAIKVVTDHMRAEGVDVDGIIFYIEFLFDYDVPGLAAVAPRNSVNDDLRPAFNGLLANVNMVKLAQLIPQLAQTEDGQEFLAYVQGPDFRAAIDAVKAEPTTEALLTYLENNGLEDVREIIRRIGEALGIEPNHHAIVTNNFSDLVGELLTTVDIYGLVETYLRLNIYDEAFRNLEFFLGSDFEAAYFRLKAHPAIKVVADRLRSEGVDVDAITAFIQWVFAWEA